MRSKDEGRAPILITVSSLLLGFATIAVVARLYTRKKLARESFRPDDWLISAATISYAARPFYIIATGLTKISVLVFLARLNPYISIAFCIKALIIATSAYIVIGTLCAVVECVPISITFNFAKLTANKQTNSCMGLYVLVYAIPAVNTFLDFLVWTLPLNLIWHVRATLRERLAMGSLWTSKSGPPPKSLPRSSAAAVQH
ncbi:hypothetical protein RUND412_000421 [Rhizina undulata]